MRVQQHARACAFTQRRMCWIRRNLFGSLRIGLYLSICLQNVSGRVRSGQVCVDSGGETITADHNATEDGEEVVAENDFTVGRWRRLVRLPLLHLVLRCGLRLVFRHPNQHKLAQI